MTSGTFALRYGPTDTTRPMRFDVWGDNKTAYLATDSSQPYFNTSMRVGGQTTSNGGDPPPAATKREALENTLTCLHTPTRTNAAPQPPTPTDKRTSWQPSQA